MVDGEPNDPFRADIDVKCEPSASGSCEPCTEKDMDEPYCSTSGLREEVRCFVGYNGSLGESERESYFTFQSCLHKAGTQIAALVRFEALMLCCFAISFSIVRRRKKRLYAIQHHRIQSYLS